MAMQRYIARHREPANPNGAVAWYSHENRATLAKVEDCPCDDGVRRTVFPTGPADTFYSIPAVVSIHGRAAVGYLTSSEGGMQFRFVDSTVEAFGLARVELDEVTGNPATWRRYAVSYGNGNDGLSRLYPAFTLECHPAALETVARLAITSTRRASRAYLARALVVDEVGPDAVQACIFDAPRSPGWCEANGAWMLADVYPADEVSDRSEAPHYHSPVAAFGRAAALI